jgi:uncharacterized protein YbaR (Trm112 family)
MQQFIETLSQCPKCKSSQLTFDDHQIICKNCNSEFAIVNNKPVFIREDNEIFSPSFYTNTVTNHSPKEKNIFSKIVPSPSIAFNHVERIQNFAQT